MIFLQTPCAALVLKSRQVLQAGACCLQGNCSMCSGNSSSLPALIIMSGALRSPDAPINDDSSRYFQEHCLPDPALSTSATLNHWSSQFHHFTNKETEANGVPQLGGSCISMPEGMCIKQQKLAVLFESRRTRNGEYRVD